MKLHLRWQILLAALCGLLVLSLLSFQVQTALLCTTVVPAAGGVYAEGMVGAPSQLTPVFSANNPVDRELTSLIFDGLTAVNEKGIIVPALAEKWTISEDGQSVQFTLKPDIFWHDGEPVTAADVAFTYGLIQAEDFPGSPALKMLWDSVEINQVDERTIEFTLAEPYSPFLEATTMGILPQHILGDISATDLSSHSFNQAPVGTGPWMVAERQDWQTQNRLQLVPNPMVWREGTEISALEFRFYPDAASLIEAFSAGEVQAVNNISADVLPEVAAMPDVRLFTAVTPRTTMLFFNLSSTASDAIRPLEMRQALAYALDKQALIDETLFGQGVPVAGPYLPDSWAYNPGQVALYAHDPLTATARLENNDWLLAEGQNVRQLEGESLSLRLLTLAEAPYLELAENIQKQWQAVNIQTEILTAADLAELRTMLRDGEFDIALVDVTASSDPDLYDFWSQEAIVRGQNYSGWNNRRASEALERGRQVWGMEERRPYYDTFIRIYENNLPALTLFQHVNTYALSQNVNEAEIGYIASPRDRYKTFADWFLLYRDVTISCPAEETEISDKLVE